MKLEDLESVIRLAVVGESRPTLAALTDSGALLDSSTEGEFAEAGRTLAARISRARQAVTKPDEMEPWV